MSKIIQSMIHDVSFWYDLQNQRSVNTTGNNVVSFEDDALKGARQNKSSNTAEYIRSKFFNSIYFDGTVAPYSSANAIDFSAEGYSLFIVLKMDGLSIPVSTPMVILEVGENANLFPGGLFLSIPPSSDDTLVNITDTDFSPIGYNSKRANIDSDVHVISSSMDRKKGYGDELDCRIDGNQFPYTIREADTIPDIENDGFLYIGGRNGVSYLATVSIYEIVMFRHVLQNEYIEKIEGALAWKYNLHDNLAESHPYKNKIPVCA